MQWASDGTRLAYVETRPLPRKGDTLSNSIDVADTATRAVDTLRLRTHTSEQDEEWLAPAITWSPSGHQLAVVARQPGRPTTLYTVVVRHSLGSRVPIDHGAYPPLAWLPQPG